MEVQRQKRLQHLWLLQKALEVLCKLDVHPAKGVMELDIIRVHVRTTALATNSEVKSSFNVHSTMRDTR